MGGEKKIKKKQEREKNKKFNEKRREWEENIKRNEMRKKRKRKRKNIVKKAKEKRKERIAVTQFLYDVFCYIFRISVNSGLKYFPPIKLTFFLTFRGGEGGGGVDPWTGAPTRGPPPIMMDAYTHGGPNEMLRPPTPPPNNFHPSSTLQGSALFHPRLPHAMSEKAGGGRERTG
jgi:hypothetical protein